MALKLTEENYGLTLEQILWQHNHFLAWRLEGKLGPKEAGNMYTSHNPKDYETL